MALHKRVVLTPTPAGACLMLVVAAVAVAFPTAEHIPGGDSNVTVVHDAAAAAGDAQLLAAATYVDDEECVLIGPGFFGWAVQISLGLVSFSALLVKRSREHPQRPRNVFILDSFKQVSGALTIHCLNMAFAQILSHFRHGDPCDWYWLNIFLDTTIGVWVAYLLLGQVKKVLHTMSDLPFGDYGTPPQTKEVILQLAAWQVVVVVMKFVMLALMVALRTPLVATTKIVLFPVSHFPKLKLVFVMIITPTVMSAVQYWITDSFIKNSSPPHAISPDLDASGNPAWRMMSSLTCNSTNSRVKNMGGPTYGACSTLNGVPREVGDEQRSAREIEVQGEGEYAGDSPKFKAINSEP